MSYVHGSALEHKREATPIETPRRLCPRCRRDAGVQRRATHAGRANGVALMVGCEWHAYAWVKDPLA